MVIFKVLFFPLAVIFDLITRLRNRLYDTGQKRSFRFHTMVIGVGNLSAGGEGKSPMVEYLVNLLKPGHSIATLSRGYGRETKGIRFATAADNARTIGDEPMQFMTHFGSEVNVVVGEERATAIPEILHTYPETDIIVLDDAFQHRSVEPQLSVLLTRYEAPFYNDFVLPSGRLRESRKGASRADVIIVTKCPVELTDDERRQITAAVVRYSGEKPVFFTTIGYELPAAFNKIDLIKQDVILVTGIANPEAFVSWAKSRYNVIRHFSFPDHHVPSTGELDALLRYFTTHAVTPSFLTTEKDRMRLQSIVKQHPVLSLPWFSVPIKVTFLKNGPEFDNLVLRSVEKSKIAV